MPITLEVAVTCLLIIAARIADVTLGTIRTVAVINGRRWASWALGFAEVLIWIIVVSQVIKTIDQHPLYPLAYAFGFATGNFIGITIETRLAFGEQQVRIFTRAANLAPELRSEGFGVTEFDGRGRDGPVQMLFVQAARRDVPRVLATARRLDESCFYLVDDVRMKSGDARRRGWLARMTRG